MRMIRKKNLKNKSGQALVEYMLVVALVVTALAWGFSILKCKLYGVWVTIACDVFFPYPENKDDSGILRQKICNKDSINCEFDI